MLSIDKKTDVKPKSNNNLKIRKLRQLADFKVFNNRADAKIVIQSSNFSLLIFPGSRVVSGRPCQLAQFDRHALKLGVKGAGRAEELPLYSSIAAAAATYS